MSCCQRGTRRASPYGTWTAAALARGSVRRAQRDRCRGHARACERGGGVRLLFVGDEPRRRHAHVVDAAQLPDVASDLEQRRQSHQRIADAAEHDRRESVGRRAQARIDRATSVHCGCDEQQRGVCYLLC